MQLAMASQPRYPKICVQVESQNPFALVAAVREALRLAHVTRTEIQAFSDEALASNGPRHVRCVCRRWVKVEPETRA